jgi:SAM-dependent methyltransferase
MMLEHPSETCLLCQLATSQQIAQDKRRPYYLCHNCALVFVPNNFHLTATEEKAQYDLHQNHPEDPGYRQFLNRTLEPLFKQIPPPAKGLDFGSGPGPTAHLIAEQLGYDMHIYDPYYAPNDDYLNHKYDFISATEVLEHISQPMPVLEQLAHLLKAKGVLAIMTKRVEAIEKFGNWHYKNDPTHIAFYQMQTFDFIAHQLGFKVQEVARDVVFLIKQ